MLAACRGEPVDRTPVWFMRQAGRCLADYRRLRERYGILELARTPELCAQVTLHAGRTLGVDGAVLFADIMLPLERHGRALSIEPEVGPIIHQPMRTLAAVEAPARRRAAEATPSSCSRRSACSAASWTAGPLIGFAGAPYTLASYLIEGRPITEHARAKAAALRRRGRLAPADGDPDRGRPSATCAPRSPPASRWCSCSTPGWATWAGATTRPRCCPTAGASSRPCGPPACRPSTSAPARSGC